MTGEVPPATGGPGELRASHADRDHVVEVLRIAAGDGRLTADELDQRLEAALTARTLGELALLTTDLPAAPSRHAVAAAAQAKDLVRIDCVASNTKRDGAWVVPRRMEVRVNGGSVRLDFTQATITGPLLELAVDVQHGHLVLVTGPGIVVDADDVAVEHGHVKAPHPAQATTLALRIEVTGTVRGGTLMARAHRPHRRTFLQWLLRRPASTPPALTR